MRLARLAALLAVVLPFGAVAATARADTGAPTGLHAFLLRADEPQRTTFSRTPAFAWNPVPGALHYEFQLSLSSQFHDNSVLYADYSLSTPVDAPSITLPWITGNPHSLYARVRAVTPDGATPWSASYGFDMAPPAAPAPLPGYPGLLRWTPVEGAAGYEIWLVDAHKFEVAFTNVLDEREFYTFHQTSAWTGSVRWRIRALRGDFSQVGSGSAAGAGRVNGVPAVQYGPWSATYSSTNPAFSGGPIKLLGTVSDVFSNGSAGAPAHRLMPGFLWSGNQASDGTAAELFRVYVFTDKQCLNTVFTSAVVGSPAYAPRPFGPLSLPQSGDAVATARAHYLSDGSEPASFMYDGTSVTPTEMLPDASPTTAAPSAPGDTTGTSGTPSSPGSSSSSAPSSSSGSSGSSSASAPATGGSGTVTISGRTGAPVDLWDTDWPSSGYYWTVVPVTAQPPDALATNVAAPGATAGSGAIPVASGAGINVGDVLSVGSGPTTETVSVTGVTGNTVTISGKLANGHGAGEPVVRSSGNLVYHDLELPQDVCAAGRVARFGKNSEPALTSSGDLFATGLSSDGRLTSAVHTTSFYGQPLVSWTPALGAWTYEVQWSKTQYPFIAEQTSSGQKGIVTFANSVVLPIGPGVWWYRVRGFDYSLPTGAQQMSWSDPAKLVVSAPKFKIVSGGAPAASSKPAKRSAPAKTSSPTSVSGLTRAVGTGFTLSVPSAWKEVTLKDSIATFVYRSPVARNSFYANVNVLQGSGRAGRAYAQWASDLAAQFRTSTGIAPSTAIVTLPAGKAVRLTASGTAGSARVTMLQYVIDAGATAYLVTYESSSASYPSYAPLFAKSIATFHLG